MTGGIPDARLLGKADFAPPPSASRASPKSSIATVTASGVAAG